MLHGPDIVVAAEKAGLTYGHMGVFLRLVDSRPEHYGFTAKLREGRLASGRSGGRHRFREAAILGFYIARNWFLPGRERMVPYSIQTLKRLKPALFRQDLIALLDLLQQQKIKPLIAHRLPLVEARHAQELLGKGGVVGKIVLVRNGSLLESGAA